MGGDDVARALAELEERWTEEELTVTREEGAEAVRARGVRGASRSPEP